MAEREITFDSWKEWLKDQSFEEPTDYLNYSGCPIARYLSSLGYENPRVYSCGIFTHGPCLKNDTPYIHEDVGVDRRMRGEYPIEFDAHASAPTMGQALERARA